MLGWFCTIHCPKLEDDSCVGLVLHHSLNEQDDSLKNCEGQGVG